MKTLDDKALILYEKMSALDTYFLSQLVKLGGMSHDETVDCINLLLYCEFILYRGGVYFLNAFQE